MTEAEWLACANAEKLLVPLRGWGSDRKFRLFACACVRRVCHFFETAPKRDTLLVAERFADGACDKWDLLTATQAASVDERDCDWRYCWSSVFFQMGYGDAWTAAQSANSEISRHHKVNRKESRIAHSALVRDIFGNPFCPVAADPSWLTSTVVQLAEGIYQERAFDRMPILADALQDAGCDNEEILTHCRGPGPHVRGCWVVDLILGKK